MDFPAYNFEALGETDVREEIVAPLLKHLGYRSGTADNVIREQHLTYSALSLGRRKSTDPPLRGKDEYICEARGQVEWVIEAKAPGEVLDALVEEQAWTYANHPEVRAVYFVVTNGRSFKLYQTNRGPGGEALFECTYDELGERLTAIENLLSPSSILRDHPEQQVDTGSPLGPGLRSIVRVTSGHILWTSISPPVPPLQQMVMIVTGGSVERMEDGSLKAHLWSLVPFQSLQELNEKLGLDQMRLSSVSTVISADLGQPTVFQSETQTTLPQGIDILDPNTWRRINMPVSVEAVVRTRATGYLVGTEFVGNFIAEMDMKMNSLMLGMKSITNGRFRLQLA